VLVVYWYATEGLVYEQQYVLDTAVPAVVRVKTMSYAHLGLRPMSCIPSSADELYKLVLCMPLAPYIIDKLCLSIYSGLYKPEYSICMCLIRHIHIHTWSTTKYIQLYQLYYIRCQWHAQDKLVQLIS
jgi:hypothetical protein